MREKSCEVLVVGGGPSGASAAYWLAKSGLDVILVDKKTFPRKKTCGDGLTPRAVSELLKMGISESILGHKYYGLRAIAFGNTLELNWPNSKGFPKYGYTITRYNLDDLVLENAAKAGARLHTGTEIIDLSFDSNCNQRLPVSAISKDKTFKFKFLVVADGSNSRVGRTLDMKRDKRYPLGLAIRTYFDSSLSEDHMIESHLDIKVKQGDVIPGYGWVFPLGNGKLNVGAGLLTTANRWKGLNTTTLFEAFTNQIRERWALGGESSQDFKGGKLPMGLCMTPRIGLNWIGVGDSLGSINPFNGEGISYGYETGRLGAHALIRASQAKTNSERFNELQNYENVLLKNFRNYYDLASLFVSAMGRPNLLKFMLKTGMRSKVLMSWALEIMANLASEEDFGIPELLIKGLGRLSSFYISKKPVKYL